MVIIIEGDILASVRKRTVRKRAAAGAYGGRFTQGRKAEDRYRALAQGVKAGNAEARSRIGTMVENLATGDKIKAANELKIMAQMGVYPGERAEKLLRQLKQETSQRGQMVDFSIFDDALLSIRGVKARGKNK